jgi:outer membrane protein assembly factor BamB
MHALRRKSIVLPVLAAALAAGAGFAATATAAAKASASPATVSSPWSQTDFNSARSRANLAERTLTRATLPQVRYLRSVVTPLDNPFGGTCTFNAMADPLLTGGSLYAVANGRLTKYNPATGHVIWRRRVSVSTVGTSLDFNGLSVADGLVVVGETYCGSVSDPTGFVQAYNASTGALVWSKPIVSIGGPLNQMVVSGAYVAAAGDSPGGGDVVSVRRLSNGAAVWHRFPACGSGDVAVMAGLVISARCNSGNPALVASHIATGTQAWSLPGTWTVQRGDHGSGTGHLFATNPSGAVVGLNPATGQTLYTLAGATNVIAVDGARAYSDCGTGVCAYSTATGAQVWTQPGAPTSVIAAEAGGVLYLGQDQGFALNTRTGKIIETVWNGSASGLAIGDGRIAVVTDERVIDLFGLHGF